MDVSGTADWSFWSDRIARVTRSYCSQGLNKQVNQNFRRLIMDYYCQHGRHELPWRRTADSYCILVSEIMLQQTQVERVIDKYRAFIKEFPDIRVLAQATLQRVLKVWQGLGYNRRALALKKTAQIVLQRYQGRIPATIDTLQTLPGIGKATASAICVYANNQSIPFIETNIRTVFLHVFFPEAASVPDHEIMPLVKTTSLYETPREWFQGLMDFGVFLKKHVTNPNRRSSLFKKQSAFKGSNREIRGTIIRLLTKSDEISIEKLIFEIKCTKKRLYRIIDGLQRDGLIEKQGSSIRITKHSWNVPK
jgi:A/G-specific adenine glycosylase